MGLAAVTKVKISIYPPAAVLYLHAAVHRPQQGAGQCKTAFHPTPEHFSGKDLGILLDDYLYSQAHARHFPRHAKHLWGFSTPRNVACFLEAILAHVG